MTLCLEYQAAVAQTAGIGRYVKMLARGLAQTAEPQDTLRLFCLDFRNRLDKTGAGPVDWRVIRYLPGSVVQRLWRAIDFPPFEWLAGEADVYHFTNFISPPLRRGRSIATIFDMSFERFPQCAEERNLKYIKGNLARTAERADAILTISRFSAREIEELLPQARGKTHAIHPGIDSGFRVPRKEHTASLRKKLGLARPYILTVGTIEPRKNLIFFTEVFERLGIPDLEWVVAGRAGWKCEPIFERFENSPRAASIRYLPDVADEDLPSLYAGADLMALPSLYEGFGFPPLEAMACGTPVVSSAGGSLPEVLGAAAYIVEGFEVEAWTAAIERVIGDSEGLKDMVRAGFEQAGKYRWENTARETWELYRRLAK